MTDDIVTRLRQAEWNENPHTNVSLCAEAADEIERLREWAAYEHAGYCGCAGGDNDCLDKAYATWKKVFGD